MFFSHTGQLWPIFHTQALLHSQKSGRAQEDFGWRNFLFDLLIAKPFVRFPIYPLRFGLFDRIILPIAKSNVSVPERSGILQGSVTITNCWEKLRQLLDCPGSAVYSQVPFHLSIPHDQAGIASLFPYHQSLGQHHQPKRCWAARKKSNLREIKQKKKYICIHIYIYDIYTSPHSQKSLLNNKSIHFKIRHLKTSVQLPRNL